jgi:hypothetical protein
VCGSGLVTASNATYVITHGGVLNTVTVDQPNNAGQWVSLGVYDFNSGAADKIQLSDHANGSVVADAVQLRPVSGFLHNATWKGVVSTAGSYQFYARWPSSTTLATDA